MGLAKPNQKDSEAQEVFILSSLNAQIIQELISSWEIIVWL